MVSAALPSPLLFLRHGRTARNAVDRVCGATDVPLDAVGRRQAAEAAFLAGVPLRDLDLRPRPRALHGGGGGRGQRRAAARAGGIGGARLGRVGGRPAHLTLVRDATPPGGEGPDAFADRTRAALATIPGPGPVLVVAHSGTARVIRALLSGGPFERLDNCALLEWRLDGVWSCHTRFAPRC